MSAATRAEESAELWPPALRKWVERAFGSCRTDTERACVSQSLRTIIIERKATLWTTDWDAEPLPARTAPRAQHGHVHALPQPGDELKALIDKFKLTAAKPAAAKKAVPQRCQCKWCRKGKSCGWCGGCGGGNLFNHRGMGALACSKCIRHKCCISSDVDSDELDNGGCYDDDYGGGGGFGYGSDAEYELMCQGVKPWDDDAGDVLAILYGDDF